MRDPRLGTSREVELPAGTLRYHEAGAGRPIVFVHGYLVNANLWRKVVPLLSEHFRCLTPDLPLGSHLLPVNRDADLTPPGMAKLIADFLDALGLDDVVLFGNDSGGAYSQLTAATYPERVGRLVLSSCETPQCTWPPTPGGFPLLKWTAVHPAPYRALYQVLRFPKTWRWRNTYGWLAKYPIDAATMRSFIDPVLTDPAIRHDGRKAIGAVDARYTRAAAQTLAGNFHKPVDFLWAAEDHVFPLTHATPYADQLGADLHLIPDAYTYVTEDNPEAVAKQGLTLWQQ
ncbi:alpha/beta hydrolase [Kribbella sp. HUAS MG21]|jgi:pimeloyl-ACP methyl ester carboxylesterase|uniref:Alpha/beta hydrolase n=1 Tax=Kribbella sp. HUAS MG21 TaxID=3160966 RepID=A0AAU7TQ62_9ACTN